MSATKKLKKFARYSPRKFFLSLSAVLVMILGALIWYFAGSISVALLYPAWLACVSLVTFIFYAYDKRQALANPTSGTEHIGDEPFVGRVPESVLHVLALAGGFIGAWCGRMIFHHKTRKIFFTVVIVMSLVIHAALAVWLYL